MPTAAHPLQIRSLENLPTISTGRCCDLKIENGKGERWWLCRMPAEHTDHRITIEKYSEETRTWQATQVFND